MIGWSSLSTLSTHVNGRLWEALILNCQGWLGISSSATAAVLVVEMEVALEERVLVVGVSLPAAAAVVALSDALHATPHIPVAYDTNVTPMSYFPVLAYSMSKLQNSRNFICSAHPGYRLLFSVCIGGEINAFYYLFVFGYSIKSFVL